MMLAAYQCLSTKRYEPVWPSFVIVPDNIHTNKKNNNNNTTIIILIIVIVIIMIVVVVVLIVLKSVNTLMKI